jgi:hypothetical protein
MMDMGGGMPPMDPSAGMDPSMGGMPGDPSMGGAMPQDGAMPPADAGMPTSFDSNFDAGVEADEETDPKTYIQQLTGKLSQTLNSYNNENGEPDTELGKYVLGMLVKQGTKGMDDKDRKEIIKKINTSNSEGDEMPEDDMPEEGMEEPQGEEAPGMDEMPMESVVYNFTKKQIFESFGIAMDEKNVTPEPKEPSTKITPDTVKNNRNIPFRAPKKINKK